MKGPLTGVRVLELAGLGPMPHTAMLLADLGAEVVRIERPGGTDHQAPDDPVLRGRTVVELDLKDPTGRGRALALCATADVLLEGYRPGVAERLGLGPDDCRDANPSLVYGRVTGWGRQGPLAERAGHDINYLAVGGALGAIGHTGTRPVPPLNLVGDYGGGSLVLALGVVAALLEREHSGEGQVVDAAIVDGVASLLQPFWRLAASGFWGARGSNIVDSGAPFYDTYECRDGRYVAVGALESRFYERLIVGLGLEGTELPDRDDPADWPALRRHLAAAFMAGTRDEWAEVFADDDACVTPVLNLMEAAEHSQLAERGTVTTVDGILQAAPVPRFSRSRLSTPPPPRRSRESAIISEGGDRGRWSDGAERLPVP